MFHRVLYPLVVLAFAFAAAPAHADTTFTDPVGDSGAAPDVTQVVVSNDNLHIVLAFALPNPWPNLVPAPDEAWLLRLDTDRNPSTGDGGDEVQVFHQQGAIVEVWNGSAWVSAPPNGISVRYLISSSSASWRVQLPRELLAGATAVDFGLSYVKFSGEEITAADRAPDSGTWRYELALAQCGNGRDDDGDGKIDTADRGCSGAADDLESDDPVTLRLGLPTVTPVKARPGASVVVGASAKQVETGLPIRAGGVVCTTRLGGTTKRTIGRIAAGLATCRIVVPRLTRPMKAVGTMTIVGTTTRGVSFSFRVA